MASAEVCKGENKEAGDQESFCIPEGTSEKDTYSWHAGRHLAPIRLPGVWGILDTIHEFAREKNYFYLLMRSKS